MEKRKLTEARQLIQKKEYVRASKLLETMLDNGTAMKWYLQIEIILANQKPLKKNQKKLKILGITFGVFGVLLAVLFGLYTEYNTNQFYEKYKERSIQIVSVLCQLELYVKSDSFSDADADNALNTCNEWGKEVINADRKNGWVIDHCDKLYKAIGGDKVLFSRCLIENDFLYP